MREGRSIDFVPPWPFNEFFFWAFCDMVGIFVLCLVWVLDLAMNFLLREGTGFHDSILSLHRAWRRHQRAFHVLHLRTFDLNKVSSTAIIIDAQSMYHNR